MGELFYLIALNMVSRVIEMSQHLYSVMIMKFSVVIGLAGWQSFDALILFCTYRNLPKELASKGNNQDKKEAGEL